MFECLFETRHLGAIAGKVVDDTEDIVIPVSGVPPVPPKVVCSDYTTESTCTDAGCHWWDGDCHDKPKVPPDEFPWEMVIAAVGGVVIVIGLIFAFKGR